MSTQPTEQLKPCPICGHPADKELDHAAFAACSNLKCSMSDCVIYTESWQALPRIERARKFSEQLPEDGQMIMTCYGTDECWDVPRPYKHNPDGLLILADYYWLPMPPPPQEK